jgi:hypothetical protein
MNDIDLIHNRFYLDPSVFNSANFDGVVSRISFPERVRLNAESYRSFFHEFKAPQTRLFCGLLLFVLLISQRRGSALTSCSLLLAAMLAVVALGRPGVEYIYIPVFLGLIVMTALEADTARQLLARRFIMLIASLSLVMALVYARSVYANSAYVRHEAKLAQAEMCTLPDDKFRVVWGVKGIFPYDYTYRPFSPLGGDCGRPFYPIGGLELAAPVLDQLRAVTGKNGLVEALLSGQSFYIFASGARLKLLKTFFREHYSATLATSLVSKGRSYTLYEMHIAKT